jgi:hypothetical protein
MLIDANLIESLGIISLILTQLNSQKMMPTEVIVMYATISEVRDSERWDGEIVVVFLSRLRLRLQDRSRINQSSLV